MGSAVLVEYFSQLPQRRASDDPEAWQAQRHKAIENFRRQVQERYSEGTLIRLTDSPDARTRLAAVYALGMMGTMAANAAVAARLHDDDGDVRHEAVDTLWTLWLRADSDENNAELERLVRLRDAEQALAGLTSLIERAPRFAEAYNQRAVAHFKARRYEQSIADCEKTLQLNPVHFGSQIGMAQCLLQLRKHRAALKAFRNTLKINPYMDGIAETIRSLEAALGEEETPDDKKK